MSINSQCNRLSREVLELYLMPVTYNNFLNTTFSHSGHMEWHAGSFLLEGEFLIPEWTRSPFPTFWRVDTGWTSQTMLLALRKCKEDVCGKWNVINSPLNTHTHTHTHKHNIVYLFIGASASEPHTSELNGGISHIHTYIIYICIYSTSPLFLWQQVGIIFHILTGSCRFCRFCSIYPRSCKMMFPISYLVYKCKLLCMFTNNIPCL